MQILISGTAGTGKTSLSEIIISLLNKTNEINSSLLLSSTTRFIRDGEKDGIDYHFLSLKEFKEEQSKGNLFNVFQAGTILDKDNNKIERLYGIPKIELTKSLEQKHLKVYPIIESSNTAEIINYVSNNIKKEENILDNLFNIELKASLKNRIKQMLEREIDINEENKEIAKKIEQIKTIDDLNIIIEKNNISKELKSLLLDIKGRLELEEKEHIQNYIERKKKNPKPFEIIDNPLIKLEIENVEEKKLNSYLIYNSLKIIEYVYGENIKNEIIKKLSNEDMKYFSYFKRNENKELEIENYMLNNLKDIIVDLISVDIMEHDFIDKYEYKIQDFQINLTLKDIKEILIENYCKLKNINENKINIILDDGFQSKLNEVLIKILNTDTMKNHILKDLNDNLTIKIADQEVDINNLFSIENLNINKNGIEIETKDIDSLIDKKIDMIDIDVKEYLDENKFNLKVELSENNRIN
jgi:guanylate kinase